MKCVDCPVRFKCEELVPDEEYCPYDVYETVKNLINQEGKDGRPQSDPK
jgi:hypothetical protein